MNATRPLAIAVVVGAISCADVPPTVFERLIEARRLNAEALVQFVKAADASNRAVMGDREEAAAASAREAEQANAAVQQSIEQLKPLLVDLHYSDESRLLGDFEKHFAEYRALDQRIHDMVADSSNLRAQRLSFGEAWQDADAFVDALMPVVPLAAAGERPRIEALVATAVAAVREIQALEAPHIAETNDASMTRLEKRMQESQDSASRALRTIADRTPPGAQPRLKAATAAFDRFMDVNGQIVELSRRNSNVNALALSLGEKRTLVAACEESLRTIQSGLDKKGLGATR